MQALQDSDAGAAKRLVTLDQKLAELATSLAQSAARYRADQQRQQGQKDLDSLRQQHRQIEQRRNQRIDQKARSPGCPTHPPPLVGAAGVRAGPAGRAPADIGLTAASCWNWTTRSADWAKSTGGSPVPVRR